jgi:hypothetical protein
LSGTTSAELPGTLTNLRTQPLFVMRLNVRPIQTVGAAAGDPQRRVGVVFGGSFVGDRLLGTVLDGGNDWQTLGADGTVTLDVRLLLRTSDGALIGMTYRGLRHGPPDILARIERGEVVNPTTHYFRIVPFFETESVQYSWLNRIIGIGIGWRHEAGPLYTVFEVL